MKIRELYLLIAAVVALVLGNTACQSARRPAALLPAANSSAPALSPTPTPAPQSRGDAKSVSAATNRIEVEADPVAELISQVENEYEVGQDNFKAGHLEAAK